MAQAPRPASMFPAGRQSSYPVAQQSSALAARIASKKAELDNLKELRDLSGVLASQMQALEEKLSTLKDGTEGWLSLDILGPCILICLQLSPAFSQTGVMFCGL